MAPDPSAGLRVTVVHDYLTQRGGAERVVLSMLRAFPNAALYTSVFDPTGTFAEFSHREVRTLGLDRSRIIRRSHRLAFPLLARGFSRLELDADVVLCSSSGWAHGVKANGGKVVYCYSPARWLYEPERYLGPSPRRLRGLALTALRPRLLRWDRTAAGTAARYVAVSETARAKVSSAYGIDPEVVYPPPGIRPEGAARRVAGVDPGFFLCVARLLPYKNVDAVLEAFGGAPEWRLVVVGSGPEGRRLRRLAPRNAELLGSVSDEELRWLYANAAGVVAAGYDDYGLTALEAAAFGKPSAALRAGGALETVVENETGVFFDTPDPQAIRTAIVELLARPFDPVRLRAHAERFSEERFIAQLRSIAAHVAQASRARATRSAAASVVVPSASARS